MDGAFLPPTKRPLGADDGGGGQQGVPKLVYILVTIMAVGLVVTGLALVSTLLHANRLQDSLGAATTEIEMARSFRLLVRPRQPSGPSHLPSPRGSAMPSHLMLK